MKQPQRALHSTQQAGMVLLHFLAYDQSQISPKIPEQPIECFFFCTAFLTGQASGYVCVGRAVLAAQKGTISLFLWKFPVTRYFIASAFASLLCLLPAAI